nr:Chain S, Protein traD [Escherichia coli K-12]3D8A_T Chain T, Protein traD [Escherichia coli K-12]3D8A_U Chain U, Protein traD [Escherichia coli K-12]3D8A_V Chain V, Protein traD [Escherichia coli K-12]3D8A_W Chain W, Protein traD [Escherichia coli K-12]3D8A_X Chain X, Protein traD [Escherichia coli K-12]3D8A_Y Chain Y, Protein traD [Escherichia coli K-12]3D8A_Z Chain Z, Protein traD [Escherichia coli K-12]
GEDVEPGDDF